GLRRCHSGRKYCSPQSEFGGWERGCILRRHPVGRNPDSSNRWWRSSWAQEDSKSAPSLPAVFLVPVPQNDQRVCVQRGQVRTANCLSQLSWMIVAPVSVISDRSSSSVTKAWRKWPLENTSPS